MSAMEFLEEEYPEYHGTEEFINYLKALGKTEEEIEVIYNEALKRRGLVISINLDVCRSVREQIAEGRAVYEGIDSLYLGVPESKSISIEKMLGINAQCQYTARCIRDRIAELKDQ